jgi:hypothetical protein
MSQADDDGADVLGCACGAQGEAIRLRTALSEKRREVEAWREKHGDISQSEARFVALQAENATLRQEVERHKAAREQLSKNLDAALLANKTLADSANTELEALRRQVEEQAGKLAEVLKQEWDLRLRAEKFQTAKEHAESSLAAAQERIKELEERLPHYHNEKQCGVIAERIEQAESSLAAMTRERDDYRWKYEAETNRIGVTRLNEFNALKAERDAALSRAEAAEQERDEFSRQLVWRQSDGERKLREHIDEARLIAARSGFCYYCQASEGAAHAEFCRAFPTPPESEATRLRRQVEEQAAKLEVHERGIREASAMYNAEKQYRERAESSLAAANERVFVVNEVNKALDKDLGDRNHDLALAMDALAAMTRERDEALAVVAEYKFGQTASARILRERDAALSRAEALEKAGRVLYSEVKDYRFARVGNRAGGQMMPQPTPGQAMLDAALAAPSEPKEGAEKPVPLPWLKDGQHYCPAPIRFDLDAARCTGCGEIVPPAYPPEPCGTCGSAGGSLCPDCGPTAPTPSAGEEPWKCPGLASGGPGKCSREKPCTYCNPKFQAPSAGEEKR